MKTLIACRTCGREISPNAEACPHCGEKLKSNQTATGLLAAIIIGLIIGLVVYFAITGPSNSEVKMNKTLLEEQRELGRKVGEWNELAKRAGR